LILLITVDCAELTVTGPAFIRQSAVLSEKSGSLIARRLTVRRLGTRAVRIGYNRVFIFLRHHSRAKDYTRIIYIKLQQ
jgi:hypothetical protein